VARVRNRTERDNEDLVRLYPDSQQAETARARLTSLINQSQ
jgi:outer membrane protein assembly factor BamD (BamD/ComL family)